MKLILIFIIVINSLFAQLKDPNFETARDYYLKGDFKNSMDYIIKVLEKNPNDYKAYYLKGMNYLMVGQTENAVDDLSQAIKLNGNFAEAFNARGLAYGYEGKLDLSLQDFDRAIIIDPDFIEALVNRGSALLENAQPELAMKDFDQCIKLDSNHPSAYFQRARIKMIANDWQSASKDIAKSIMKGLVNSEAYYELGNCYFMQKDFKSAEVTYSAGLLLDPNHHKTLNNRALCYEEMGEKAKAEADRKKLRELAGINFQEIEKIKFKTFKTKNGIIKIDLPDTWFVKDLSTEADETVLQVSVKKNETDLALSAIVKITYSKNMKKRFDIYDRFDLIEFWKSSNAQNSKDYQKYSISSQKIKQYKDFYSIIFETYRVEQAKDMPLSSMEFVAAKEDQICVAYFQAPVNQYDYFKPIFEKALGSLDIK